jgi:hypothetical protein
MTYTVFLNLLFLGHAVNLFPLNINSSDLLCILVLFILFAWSNNCSHLLSNCINKFCIPASQSSNYFISNYNCYLLFFKSSKMHILCWIFHVISELYAIPDDESV